MKKTVLLCLCLLLTVCLAAPAAADVIWEPDDDFYNEHWEKMERSDGSFTAEADTTIYKSPVDSTPTGVIPAGDTVDTPYIFTDSRYSKWGYVEWYADGAWVQGWVNLSDPAGTPRSPFVSTAVILVVVAAAAAAVCILFVGDRSWMEGKKR